MPLVLKVRIGKFDTASRDHRELSAAQEAGFDVKVLASAYEPEEAGTIKTIKGFESHMFYPWKRSNSTINPQENAGPKLFKLPFDDKEERNIVEKGIRFLINRVFGAFVWSRKVRTFHADVISCHDLPALFVGYMSTLFMSKNKKPKLIYDSHEFELGRNTNPPRSRFRTWMIKQQEGFLIKRCAINIMVNDSIADEVQKIYKLKEKPLVVRSTPTNWILDPTVCYKRRQELIRMANVDSDAFFVMYHGGIIRNRGIETFIRAVVSNPNITGIILGFALDEKYMDELKSLVSEQNVANRILFLPAVPLGILWEYVGAVDVGVMPIQNICKNHYFSLPNKFFENIQSLTPIIASDLPEMRRLIEKYNIGLTCDQTSVESLNSGIEKLRIDKELYGEMKRNLVAAKNDLCWEKEKLVLIEAYKKLAK